MPRGLEEDVPRSVSGGTGSRIGCDHTAGTAREGRRRTMVCAMAIMGRAYTGSRGRSSSAACEY